MLVERIQDVESRADFEAIEADEKAQKQIEWMERNRPDLLRLVQDALNSQRARFFAPAMDDEFGDAA